MTVAKDTLKAVVLVCTLKGGRGKSSSDKLGREVVEGRMLTFGKVAVVAVVGNEDGAHHVSAEVFQALNDVGFTVPAAGATYWVGEAMAKEDYADVGPKPDTTGGATTRLAANAAHLARLLRDDPYPPTGKNGM